jgi:hypothetical protein
MNRKKTAPAKKKGRASNSGRWWNRRKIIPFSLLLLLLLSLAGAGYIVFLGVLPDSGPAAVGQ